MTIRTIRYYDKMDLLKPSKLSDTGFRYYTDEDLVKLQQILLYKYLGFSLDEIKEMTVASADPEYLLESLQIQKKLLENHLITRSVYNRNVAERFVLQKMMTPGMRSFVFRHFARSGGNQ